ncbi:MAG: hypothetical protein EWV40_19065 [Microcystis flos-aquae Mf_WU_F_19750830_S460]|uniref:Uncharacterized protein n=1 Tax=Microcystis flos-aquae Mf_WU_F_19750830_S460 TaxID=2486237 RepID=A0A552LAF6_9CHRO|nr:MAG: hypothetical protein EWV40_19065 [Microcystis flos-aquae Mf_WU_F_19750830_S460]
MTPGSGTFWFPKSLKVLPNKVFIFIQQTLITSYCLLDGYAVPLATLKKAPLPPYLEWTHRFM